MAGPPSQPDDGTTRLHRCIRDLATLNALPSMCIGRSPEEVFDIVLDAVPTALSCELVYIRFPGSPEKEGASLHRARVPEAELPAIRAALGAGVEGARRVTVPGAGELWCLEAELPVGNGRGTFIAGRARPLDVDTDRVLVRSAANLAGTTLESAKVLEVARRKDEFLAMLGHELRNPLAPIVTAVELLRRNALADREAAVIERHARHLTRLVDDLLDISRATRGEIELRSERVALTAVLERAVDFVAPQVERHGHVLTVADAAGIVVRGDPVRLAQVFGNLLANAAKFTPPRGRIDVLVERSPGGVAVTVRDDGRGIPGHQLARIFEPFVQVDRERDALSGGLGLGLAIVSNLVKRHGGTVRAASDGVGRGASFTVTLPTSGASAEAERTAPAGSREARAGIRVLVVDDNVDVAELLSEALQLEGFQTAVEYDARAALEAWNRFRPHAAVLDVGLPRVDGYELAKIVRAQHGSAPTLIAATGYGQDSDRLRAARAGFDCHFVKPVSIEDIVVTLDARVVARAAHAVHTDR